MFTRIIALLIFGVCVQCMGYSPLFESDDYFISKTYERKDLERFAEEWANHFEVNVAIIKGKIETESSWNHKALSNKNAQGLMQVLPGTAKLDLGMTPKESLFNPYTNIYYGVKYFKRLLDRYDGSYELASIAYYAGMKWADKVEKNELKAGKFKEEIVGYAQKVFKRSLAYMEVKSDYQETKDI